MPGPSRQATFDAGALVTFIWTFVWFVISVAILSWFYRELKRIEKTLEDIRELMKGGKASGVRTEEQYR